MVRLLIVIPILLVLIVFAASNPAPVTIALWPTHWAVTAPLSVATLAIAAVFFLCGAFLVWVPAQAVRLRAGMSGRRVAKLEAQVAKLQAELDARKSARTPVPVPVPVPGPGPGPATAPVIAE